MPKVTLGDRSLGLVAVADLGGDRVAVVGLEPRHHAFHAQLERRAKCARRARASPAAAVRCGPSRASPRLCSPTLQHLVGGVDREAGLVGGEPLEQVGLSAKERMTWLFLKRILSARLLIISW